MRSIRNSVAIALASMMLAACNTWSTVSVTPGDGMHDDSRAVSTPEAAVAPSDIIVSSSDITNRKYRILGDIEVTVNKTTIFNDDPTPEMVDERLREEAAKLHADAIVLVRYGTVGASRFSTASLKGQGRAVTFVD